MARILAQKFGGTSVATPESRRMVAGHIGRAVSEGYSRAVVVAVGQDWRQPLEDDLTANGIGPGHALTDQGLVSMVGSAEFIAENYAHAFSLAESLGIRPLFRAMAGIRCTFAIPSKQVKSLVRAFYQEFAG